MTLTDKQRMALKRSWESIGREGTLEEFVGSARPYRGWVDWYGDGDGEAETVNGTERVYVRVPSPSWLDAPSRIWVYVEPDGYAHENRLADPDTGETEIP